MISQERVIDGQTGELVGNYGNVTSTTYNQVSGTNAAYNTTTSGGNYTYTTTTQQPVTYTTTTTTQQPVSTSYATNSHYVSGGNVSGGYTTSAVNSGYVSGSHVQGGHEAQIVNTVVNTGKEVIKGESRIEYVPFEKKIVEYKDEARVERVPKKRTVTEYREEKVVEEVPREVTVTDYYAVEYLRQYIPQYIPEKQIEYVAKERKVKKYEYIPVERYNFFNLDKLSIIQSNLLKLKSPHQVLNIKHQAMFQLHLTAILQDKLSQEAMSQEDMFQEVKEDIQLPLPLINMSNLLKHHTFKAHMSQQQLKLLLTAMDQFKLPTMFHLDQELDILEVKLLLIQTKLFQEEILMLLEDQVLEEEKLLLTPLQPTIQAIHTLVEKL